MEKISFDEWKKMEIRVGKILKVERLPKTEKLYKLQVDIGKEKTVQIVTSLVPYYTEEELKNQKITVLTNLKPSKFSAKSRKACCSAPRRMTGASVFFLQFRKILKQER